MKVFFDTSALAKRYIAENGSEEIDIILSHASELAVSVICIPEIISALMRSMREKRINLQQYNIAKNSLQTDLEDIFICNLTPPTIHTALNILENNSIRAMDSIHVACAAEYKTDLFVSSDVRQLEAASKYGLKVKNI